MKPVYGILLVVFLLSVRISFGQKGNNSPLDIKITLSARNETITSILEKITSQTQVFFSYDPSLLNAETLTSISITNKTIKETLDVLLHSRFEYKTLGEQIVITLPENGDLKKTETETAEKKKNTISYRGKIIDLEEKEILPYTSILVNGTTIGTISNIDGEFELKIPDTLINDTVIVSCLGYKQYRQLISDIHDQNYTIYLQPNSVQLKEIKVTVINPEDIVSKILSKINLNYSNDPEIMTSFYREILKQDDKYLDVAEAIMEIRKAPYNNSFSQDKIKFIKGRKNMNIIPFKFVDFKIQGGPYYITMLDAIKTMDSFLDPEFREFYKYTLDEIIEVDNRDTYVIHFKPKEKIDYPCYQGNLFVDMSTFALIKAEFSLSRSGLKFAHESLIKKKPKNFYVRPLNADYNVSYRRADNKWHLSHAQATINFKVKSKKDKINSTFHSDSELLVTEFKPDNGTHYKKNELFSSKDIFTDVVANYDENFWGDYNTIKPSGDLRKALNIYNLQNDSLFRINEKEERIINK